MTESRVSTLHWCDRCHQAYRGPGIDLRGGPRVCPACLSPDAQALACTVCGSTQAVALLQSDDLSDRAGCCLACQAGVSAEAARRRALAQLPVVARELAAEVRASREAAPCA